MTSLESGGRLDRFLQQELPELTRSQIKKLVTQGQIRIDDQPAKAGHPLKVGERIEVLIPPPPQIRPQPQDIPLDVIFEDADLLVIDKPAGMVVHPGAGRRMDTLVNALLGRGTPLSTIGSPDRPGIIHRLDKGTSGLLVVAKTDASHRRLSEAMAVRDITRRYWALVWGTPRPETGVITGALARSRADRRRMQVVPRGGRPARTLYEVLWSDHGVSAVLLTLETGRTHQIRAHLSHLGWPVFGDPEYGGRQKRASGAEPPVRERARKAFGVLSRQALHAQDLEFEHPRNGKRLEFKSPLPQDIRGAAVELGVPAGLVTDGVKEDS